MAAVLKGVPVSPASPRWAYLRAHPQSGATVVQGIAVEMLMGPGGILGLRYDLRADPAGLRIPRAGAGRRTDELWRHTCFEAFLAAAGTGAYYELNFSPSLEWAAYHFEGYRSGMTAPALAPAPQLTVWRRADGLELLARLRLGSLELLAAAQQLRVALAAVIEDAEGRLGYWALAHPTGSADFHHPQSFTLELTRT